MIPVVKGYFTDSVYMGYVAEKKTYIMFASESEYYDYINRDE